MCDDVDKVYIGSTTSFRHRKSAHKNSCINDKDPKYNQIKYKYIRENGGWNNWKMIEIEKYECCDKNEATAREQYWIDYYGDKTTNKNRAFVDYNSVEYKEAKALYNNEWYNENKEAISLQRTDYYNENKEAKLLYQKQYYNENKEAKALYNKEWYNRKKAERLLNTEENKNIPININDQTITKKNI